jgi:hypothetical protein
LVFKRGICLAEFVFICVVKWPNRKTGQKANFHFYQSR